MASKAYVASMTVTELKQELKQRGLSTRGSKKSLRDRLERAFDEEELNDSSSENESGSKLGPSEAGFNFSVPAESFLPPDQIREDSPVLSPERDKMIISVELSNKETLEVYSPNPPAAAREDEGGGGGQDQPLVVAVSLPNDEGTVSEQQRVGIENHNPIPQVSATPVLGPEVPLENSSAREAPVITVNNSTDENGTCERLNSTHDQTSNVASTDVAVREEEREAEPRQVSNNTAVGVEVPKREGEREERGGQRVGEGEKEKEANQSGEHTTTIATDGEGERASSEQTTATATDGEGERASSEQTTATATDVEGERASSEQTTATDVEGEKASSEQTTATDVEGEKAISGQTTATDVEGERAISEQTTATDMEGEMAISEQTTATDVEGEMASSEGGETQVQSGDREEAAHQTLEKMTEEAVDVDMGEPLQSAADSETSSVVMPQVESKVDDGKEIENVREEEKAEECGVPEQTASALTAEEDEWVIIEHAPPPKESSKNTRHSEEAPGKQEEDSATADVGEEVSENVKEPEREATPETADPAPKEEQAEEVMEVDSGRDVESGRTEPMEISPAAQEKKQLEKLGHQGSQEKSIVSASEAYQKAGSGVTQQEFPPSVPAEADVSELLTSEPIQHLAKEGDGGSAQPSEANIPPSGNAETKLSNDSPSDTTLAGARPGPTGKEEEVSEGVSMEVAVLVHAEEDDLSVFSTEAAEAQKIASSSREKARGKAQERARERDREKPSARHRRSSATAALGTAGLPVSKQASLVEAEAGSSRSGGETAASGSTMDRSSPSEETKHGEGGGAEAELPSKKRRRISAHVPSSVGAEPASIQWGGGERRRRWGSGKQRSTSNTTNISSDILKDIIPSELEVGEGDGVLVGDGEGVEMGDLGDRGGDINTEQEITDSKTQKDEHQLEWEEKLRAKEAKQREAERARQELETRQRIEARVRARLEQADARAKEQEKESGRHRTPSPARNPPTHILHVRNLTRPFTQGQLRELLSGDGPLLKDGFWTNNVKSHCIAVYGSKDAAATTRHRLHGLKWPSTNPKLLSVDFLSPEEVQKISEGDLMVMAAPPDSGAKQEKEEEGDKGEVVGGELGDGGDTGEGVKEVSQGEREAERSDRKRRRESRGADKKIDATEKTNKKGELPEKGGVAEREPTSDAAAPPGAEKAPSQATKLLDDLFRKTKATPSVYWLPLTEAEVQKKQKEREEREAEREKRRVERQKAYEEERKREREREEIARKERERRIQEERERRARERVRRRSKSRSMSSRSRSRSRSHDRYRDRDRRRR